MKDNLNFNWLADSGRFHDSSNAFAKMANELDGRQKLQDDANQATLDSLEVLKQIEMNTEYLKSIVDLLSVSNEHQKELNDMVQDILNIAKAPDKGEAQSRYRSVMKKIGDFATITTSAVNIAQLSSLALAVLKLVH